MVFSGCYVYAQLHLWLLRPGRLLGSLHSLRVYIYKSIYIYNITKGTPTHGNLLTVICYRMLNFKFILQRIFSFVSYNKSSFS